MFTAPIYFDLQAKDRDLNFLAATKKNIPCIHSVHLVRKKGCCQKQSMQKNYALIQMQGYELTMLRFQVNLKTTAGALSEDQLQPDIRLFSGYPVPYPAQH